MGFGGTFPSRPFLLESTFPVSSAVRDSNRKSQFPAMGILMEWRNFAKCLKNQIQIGNVCGCRGRHQSWRPRQGAHQVPGPEAINRNVLGGIGGFGALFHLDVKRWKNPILVSSADGVGTKLKVAFEIGIHRSIGADLVNRCVNDIAVQGATPLIFLGCFASGKFDPEVSETVVSGLADECKPNG